MILQLTGMILHVYPAGNKHIISHPNRKIIFPTHPVKEILLVSWKAYIGSFRKSTKKFPKKKDTPKNVLKKLLDHFLLINFIFRNTSLIGFFRYHLPSHSPCPSSEVTELESQHLEGSQSNRGSHPHLPIGPMQSRPAKSRSIRQLLFLFLFSKAR